MRDTEWKTSDTKGRMLYLKNTEISHGMRSQGGGQHGARQVTPGVERVAELLKLHLGTSWVRGISWQKFGERCTPDWPLSCKLEFPRR